MCEFRVVETVKLGILTHSKGHSDSYPAHEIDAGRDGFEATTKIKHETDKKHEV